MNRFIAEGRNKIATKAIKQVLEERDLLSLFEKSRNGSGKLSGPDTISIFVYNRLVVLRQARANSRTFHVIEAW